LGANRGRLSIAPSARSYGPELPQPVAAVRLREIIMERMQTCEADERVTELLKLLWLQARLPTKDVVVWVRTRAPANVVALFETAFNLAPSFRDINGKVDDHIKAYRTRRNRAKKPAKVLALVEVILFWDPTLSEDERLAELRGICNETSKNLGVRNTSAQIRNSRTPTDPQCSQSLETADLVVKLKELRADILEIRYISEGTLILLIGAKQDLRRQQRLVRELNLFDTNQRETVETAARRLDELEDHYEKLRWEVFLKGIYGTSIPDRYFKRSYPGVWSLIYNRRISRLQKVHQNLLDENMTDFLSYNLDRYLRGYYTFDEVRLALQHKQMDISLAAQRVVVALLKNCSNLSGDGQRGWKGG
jgi:hypothetical protein